jgi:uncharacterized OsmC-like protein
MAIPHKRLRNSALAFGITAALAWGASLPLAPALAQSAANRSTSAASTSGAAPRGESLRPQLAIKRAALDRLAARPAGEAEAQALQARVTAESRSGVRRLRIDDFQYLSDSGRDFGGYNLGAGSWDTEVAVLASAVADEFVIQAAAGGIALDALDVVFTSHPDAPSTAARDTRVRYPRNLRYVAHIDSPASDAELETLRQAVERVSPVLNLIAEAQPVGHGRIVHTVSPAQRDPGLPPGLRDFLVEKRSAILRRQQLAKTRPSEPYALRAHARVEPGTGLREIRTGDGNFQFIHDSRRELGGHGLAATVEQHQLGVLGTCLTHIFEIQAATREVVLDGLELTLQATLTPRIGSGTQSPPRYRDIQYTVHIESPASAQEIEGLRDAVEATCPVYNLLKDPQQIAGSIVRGRYVAEAATR